MPTLPTEGNAFNMLPHRHNSQQLGDICSSVSAYPPVNNVCDSLSRHSIPLLGNIYSPSLVLYALIVFAALDYPRHSSAIMRQTYALIDEDERLLQSF